VFSLDGSPFLMALPKVGKYVLILSVFLCTAFNATPTLRKRVEEVQFQLPMLLENRVVWKTCGDWNGSYWPDGHIELCNENLYEGLEVARIILLHELGHAYTFRYHTNFARWGGNYEDAADEFAAVFSVVQGHPEDLIAKARLWEEWEKENPCTIGDPHSCHSVRAKRFRTWYHGYTFPGSPEGKVWADALAFWKQELLRNGLN
jgi:hypothetical protein